VSALGPINASGRFRYALTAIYGGSQRKMAAALGVSQAAVSRVISGHQDPSPRMLLALSRIGELDASWVLTGEHQPDALVEQSPWLPVVQDVVRSPSEIDLVKAERRAVAAAEYSDTRYFVRLHDRDQVASRLGFQIAAGDLLLVETQPAYWLLHQERLERRFIIIDLGDRLSLVRTGTRSRSKGEGDCVSVSLTTGGTMRLVVEPTMASVASGPRKRLIDIDGLPATPRRAKRRRTRLAMTDIAGVVIMLLRPL